jgi:hypothetical protein
MTKHILILFFVSFLGVSSSFGSQMPLRPAPSYDEVLVSDEKLFANEQIEISNLFPNPANDVVKFNYVLSDANAKVKITIRNVLGSILKEEELSSETRQLEISVHEYSAGMYFCSFLVK